MNCLYFTYDGLLDPLGQSQILPYLLHLAAAGHSFAIISYEKEDRSPEAIQVLESALGEAGIKWFRLRFRSGKWELIKRVISGIAMIRKTCLSLRPDIVHLRGLMPTIIYSLSLSRVPHLYDIRAFLGEWTDIGKIPRGSVSYYVLDQIDRSAVASACGLVVLEESAKLLLYETYDVPDVPIKSIRTCTDISLYPRRIDSAVNAHGDSIGFVYLGGAKRPYRPDLALRLITQLLAAGIDCRIDFINERDHADIMAAAEEIRFPQDRLVVFKLEQRRVPEALARYDCGLIFNNSSRWRRVSSPTKFGEYLAAGLPVISLAGIDVLEQFATSTPCVEIVTQEELIDGLAPKAIERLISFIRRPGIGFVCQELAQQECSLEMAGRLYSELYAEIEARR